MILYIYLKKMLYRHININRNVTIPVENIWQKDFTFFYHMLSEVATEDPDKEKLRMFQPAEAHAFIEKYRTGNRKIMEKYFNRSEDLFKTNFQNIKKWEWNNRQMNEDIIRLLGHTTIALRKENDELLQRITKLEQTSQKQSQNISDLKSKLQHPTKTVLSKILK